MSSTAQQLINILSGLALATSSMIVSANTIIPAPPGINAEGYILIDHATGHVIAEGNADVQ